MGELRKAITIAGEIDPVSEDLLIGQAGELEKFQWFIRAHLENTVGHLVHEGASSETEAADEARTSEALRYVERRRSRSWEPRRRHARTGTDRPPRSGPIAEVPTAARKHFHVGATPFRPRNSGRGLVRLYFSTSLDFPRLPPTRLDVR